MGSSSEWLQGPSTDCAYEWTSNAANGGDSAAAMKSRTVLASGADKGPVPC